MKSEKRIEASVNDLIVLCHIVDEFDSFNKNLNKLMSIKNNSGKIYKLYQLSKNQKIFGERSIKKFYVENKNVIDIISKYSILSNFFNVNYDFQGNLRKDSHLDIFHKYILNHKDELDKILSLLGKIKDLGFDKLELAENTDFTDDEYKMNTAFMFNSEFVYLSNIKVIPNYDNNIVKYVTTGSNYKMILNKVLDSCYNCGHIIVVNNLLFDKEELPDTISRLNIFDTIKSLKDSQNSNCYIIKQSVDLSIGIDDLCAKYNILDKIVSKIDNFESKDELKMVLLQIKVHLDELKAISNEYEHKAIKQNSSITKEKIEEEKKLYLKKKDKMYIDYD